MLYSVLTAWRKYVTISSTITCSVKCKSDLRQWVALHFSSRTREKATFASVLYDTVLSKRELSFHVEQAGQRQ